MSKKILTRIIVCLIIAVFICLGTFNVSAKSSYKSYIYSNSDSAVKITPDAFKFDKCLKGKDFGINDLNEPTDIITSDKNIIIADAGNNRIVVLDKEYRAVRIIDSFLWQNTVQKFNKPMGVFLNENKQLYIADTDNSRIVIMSVTGETINVLDAPKIEALETDNNEFVYKPTAIAVDSTNRIYVVAQSVNMGIIQLSNSGEFEGFVGVQKVTYNPIEYLWKSILTEEQQSRMISFVPTEYNNIEIDSKGFLFVTSSAIDVNSLSQDIASPSKSPAVAAVKRINPNGNDVLRRNGKISISGDVLFEEYSAEDENFGPSSIVDIALGNSKTYTILDSKRGKYFTYSNDGDLLYAFGVLGSEKANAERPTAIAYNNEDLLVLDSAGNKVIVYSPTEYGNLILKAEQAYIDYDYESCKNYWKKVSEFNSNIDLAYLGMGKIAYQEGDYLQAMKYFRQIDDRINYSNALEEYRQSLFEKYFFFLALALIVVFILIVKLLGRIDKFNNKPENKNRFLGKLFYSFYVSKHPFDGFWDLKYEHRGSTSAATVLLISLGASNLVKVFGSSYVYRESSTNDYFLIFSTLGMIVFVGLYVISNWCVSTLADGEGTIKDIYTGSCYALLPLIISNILIAVISHFITAEEAVFVSLVSGIGIVWTVILIFCSTISIHRYSLLKNIFTIILSLLGILIILFLVLLLVSVLQRISDFVEMIISDLSFR